MSLPTLRRDFESTGGRIPTGVVPYEAVEMIVRRARSTRLVIWGEEHHLPQTRSLYERLLQGLWDEGYHYLASEAFDAAVMSPDFTDVDYRSGLYLMDPVYASAVRRALALGYQLVAYDTSERGPDGDAGFRDRRQAENLARVLERDADARMLVLAGRGHASEAPASDGWRPMAAVLKEVTGIDPLTIYAPTMSMREGPDQEHPLYRSATASGALETPVIFVDTTTDQLLGTGSFDAYVFWPRVGLEAGREEWVFQLPGRRKVSIPFEIADLPRPVLVQAFRMGRPEHAVPDDQVLLGDETTPALALPPGTFRVRAILPDGTVVARGEVGTEEDVQRP